MLIDALAKVAFRTPVIDFPFGAPDRSLEVDDLAYQVDADEHRIEERTSSAHTRRSSELVARS